MEVAKTNQKLSLGDGKVKTMEQFVALCDSELKVKHDSMVAEYRDRKKGLELIRDTKVAEYKIIGLIVDMNTRLNEGNVSPEAMMDITTVISSITYEEAMQSLSIRYWEREFGKSFILPVICDIVNYFVRQFVVKETLSGIQIMQYASIILTQMPSFRVKELVLMLRNALAGEYGSHWQRIGIDTLLQWQNEYFIKSSAVVEGIAVGNKESRGEQPWLIQDRIASDKLDKFKKEQEAKKQISEKVWKIDQIKNAKP